MKRTDNCKNEKKDIITAEHFVFKISLLKHLEIISDKFFLNGANAIEYGSIARTIDLQKYNIYEIASKIQNYCRMYNLDFFYETPKDIEERDFERLLSDKIRIIEDIKPQALVVNNLKLLNEIIKNRCFNNINIHIGQNISPDIIKSLKKTNITGYDCSYLQLKQIKKLPNFLIKKKRFIYGKKQKETILKCRLNTSKNGTSGLLCTAPCIKGHFELNDEKQKKFFITDGFCHTHFFDNKTKNYLYRKDILNQNGVTDYIIDLRFFD